MRACTCVQDHRRVPRLLLPLPIRWSKEKAAHVVVKATDRKAGVVTVHGPGEHRTETWANAPGGGA